MKSGYLIAALGCLLAAAASYGEDLPASPPAAPDTTPAVAEMHSDLTKRLRDIEAKVDRIIEYLRLDQRNSRAEEVDQRLNDMKRTLETIQRDIDDIERSVSRLERR